MAWKRLRQDWKRLSDCTMDRKSRTTSVVLPTLNDTDFLACIRNSSSRGFGIITACKIVNRRMSLLNHPVWTRRDEQRDFYIILSHLKQTARDVEELWTYSGEFEYLASLLDDIKRHIAKLEAFDIRKNEIEYTLQYRLFLIKRLLDYGYEYNRVRVATHDFLRKHNSYNRAAFIRTLEVDNGEDTAVEKTGGPMVCTQLQGSTLMGSEAGRADTTSLILKEIGRAQDKNVMSQMRGNAMYSLRAGEGVMNGLRENIIYSTQDKEDCTKQNFEVNMTAAEKEYYGLDCCSGTRGAVDSKVDETSCRADTLTLSPIATVACPPPKLKYKGIERNKVPYHKKIGRIMPSSLSETFTYP